MPKCSAIFPHPDEIKWTVEGDTIQEIRDVALRRYKYDNSMPMPNCIIWDGVRLSREEMKEVHVEWSGEHRRRRGVSVVEVYGSCDFPGGQ